ncbi:hypothetical protein ACIBSW_06755 [Actinoplanes sp. NPDC049668]|uniref:hypothetical protein n=1 Tax=unclassified Actinoplanes TaxID=2626549 RepID=UPI00339DFBE2
MTELAVAALALLGTLAGVLVGRRQRRATADLSEAQADEITERIYGRIVERLETEVARLTAQVGSLEQRVAALDEALRHRTAELDRVTSERDRALAELAELRTQLQARTDELAELRATPCRACPPGTP